ncbi:toll/interleukin-1 receptor domain-containing protein [Actinophytocola sp. KF-1]
MNANGSHERRSVYFGPKSDAKPIGSGLCKVFVSYARIDEAYRVRLNVHLAPLVREGLIDLWSDRAIAAGSDWERDIERELATADIVLLLVTPDFVASVYCFEKELTEAVRRHEEDGVRILPVHVKHVDLDNLPFARFQGLPLHRRPITAWDDHDEAWLQVAQGVRQAADDIYRARTTFPRQRTGEPGGELEHYYGTDNCVVDGPAADVEWIPLNEDPEDKRFDNLVPLSKRHRARRANFRFGIDLIAENLFHSARKHFHAGVPALAFGCTRLGHVLASHYPYAFEAHEGDEWAFLAQSLFYLPYRQSKALLEVTLQRVRKRLTINRNCPHAGLAGLLLAVANLYQDLGKWVAAEELYDQVLAHKPAPFMQVAAIRRRAVGRIFRGATRQAMERDFRRVGDYETSADLAVALAISQAWWHLAHGRPDEALRLLEPFDDDEAVHSPHNAVELKFTQASALIGLGLGCAAQMRFVKERARGTAHLRPVFTEYVAPLILSRRLAEAVESHAGPVVAPAGLDATADALLAAQGTTVAGRPIWVD